MLIIDSIIHWAEKDLPTWQSDAVRRILIQGELTNDDRRELLLMVKSQHSLLREGSTSIEPQPLAQIDDIDDPKSKEKVTLKSIEAVCSINRIPDESVLKFGHEGVTAIYGENGSGKSGYARVLKQACRARDSRERILPNLFDTSTPVPPKAKFKLSVDGDRDKEIEWIEGAKSDSLLVKITVFDSKCAQVIVNEKNEAIYLPFGAHVFGELVDLCNWIKEQIEADKPNLALRWPESIDDTAIGKNLADLSYETNEKSVLDMDDWTKENDDRLEKITKRLAEMEVNDPVRQASITRSLKERIVSLKNIIEKLSVELSSESIETINKLKKSVVASEKAVGLATDQVLKSELLPGAGESVWQILYSAAKEYSVTGAYPGENFPFVNDDSRCVFCMQLLDEDAKQRLRRFETFMEQKAKKIHQDAKDKLKSAVEALIPLKGLAEVSQYTNISDEISQRDPQVAIAVNLFITAIRTRIDYCDQLVSGDAKDVLSDLPESPTSALGYLAETLENEAVGFIESGESENKRKLAVEKSELTARKWFTSNKNIVLEHLAGIKTTHSCDAVIVTLDTTKITRKGKNIVSEALTPQLRARIKSELECLGASHLPLALKPIGKQGETLHQMELEGRTSSSKVGLSAVLSEGEHRVVALAGFLAEISVGDGFNPIVLDDPVSSLDHRYRSKIAERLVREADERQVLIFTHDIAFLLDLEEKCGEFGNVPFTPQTVLRHNEAAGVPNEGLPWSALPVNGRLHHLRNKQSELENLHGTAQASYNAKAAYIYALLRETWETAIEEVVFNKAVVRHGNEVQTRRLRQVGMTTEQYSCIDKNMSKCSTWMVGHDKSRALDVNRPSPNELATDVEALKNFVSSCKQIGKKLAKERDAALKPDATEIG